MLTVLSRAILRGWSTLERRSSHSSGTCNQLSPVCICPLSNDTLYTFFSLLNGTSLKVLSVGLHSKSHQQILSVRIDIHFLGGAGYILWIRCVWKIWAAADGQRRINNYQVYQVWEVLLNLLRWQPSHQVEGTVKLLLSHSAPGWSPLQGGLNNFTTNSNYKSPKLVDYSQGFNGLYYWSLQVLVTSTWCLSSFVYPTWLSQ